MKNSAELRVKREDRADGTIVFHVYVFEDGKPAELYRPCSEQEVNTFVVSIIDGFAPPRYHPRSYKLIEKIQPEL